ncbi:MAG TPA: FAD-binding oxidoreductase [Candidatus Saccharicenans sp.]|nr:FAD-binding oxidoreductase [Candidatus Saccharicenans sp.]HOL44951.1 FAD-binding oxidoreductase [Candidatus Saccharicenans sp.]HOT68247.1 FAD-binding oxidoreductase [Candidatus Saccharicenans sp.]HPC87248.1 FAD-binding oxidoreductase [Candidatus Saccharicenans sp.]HPP23311.1 FAD-binding oxidoreductase [Candidatus Saccharicenans sp.]
MNSQDSYEVIIIGAGSVGTPTALFLAEAGFKVLVIDRNPSSGQGSNKRAIGGLRATHSDPAKIRLSMRSLDIISSWKEKYGDDLEWYKGGYCFVAYREEEEKTLKEVLPLQKSLGLNIDWLEAQELRRFLPDLNPRGLRGGTLSPDDGHASPLLANEAFYRRARAAGAQFKFKENVTNLVIESGKIKGVVTDQGRYGAEVVINAAGAWAAEVARMAGVGIPVTPDSHEAAVTEPVQRFFHPMIVDLRPADGSANYYFYQHATGQVIFCITPSPSLWGFDVRETSQFLPMVSKRMIDLMPRLKNIRVRRTWRGLYPMTPDGFPIVGWTREVEGFLLAAGMCGQGFMLGPGLAELLTRIVAGQPQPADEEILSYLSPYRSFVSEEKLK